MPYVKVKENEPFDLALRRFKRSCEKAGILAEVRKREFYEKPTSVRKRRAAAAVKVILDNCCLRGPGGDLTIGCAIVMCNYDDNRGG